MLTTSVHRVSTTATANELVKFSSSPALAPPEERIYLEARGDSPPPSISARGGLRLPLLLSTPSFPPPLNGGTTETSTSKGGAVVVPIETNSSQPVGAIDKADSLLASIFMATIPSEEDEAEEEVNFRDIPLDTPKEGAKTFLEEDVPVFSARKTVDFADANSLGIFLDDEERQQRAKSARSASTVSTVSETESLQLEDTIEQLEKPEKNSGINLDLFQVNLV